MASISELGRKAWRLFVQDGLPATGSHEPIKEEIWQVTDEVEARLLAAEAVAATGSRAFETWAALAANPGQINGQAARVPLSDAGTHTDPVAGGTVANSGDYRWSTAPAGWRRIGPTPIVDMPAAIAAGQVLTVVAPGDQFGVRQASGGLLGSVSYDVLANQIGSLTTSPVATLSRDVRRKQDAAAIKPMVAFIRPSILGTVALGNTLTLDYGSWPPGTVFTQAWRADGVPILDLAGGQTFVVTAAEVGKTITAVVSGSDGTRRATYTASILPKLPASVSSVVGFGGSSTAGQGASTTAQRWLNTVATALSAGAPINQGTTGTVLQNSPDAGGTARANNGRDRWATAVTGANTAEMAIVSYGADDARYIANPAAFHVSAYLNDYREVLGGLLAVGYARNRIVVVAPHWIDDTGLASTGDAGFRGQSRAGYEAYVAASKQVADEFGVFWADAYTAIKTAAAAGQAVLGADHVALTDAGHAVVAAAVLAATKRPDPLLATTPALDYFAGANGETILQHRPEIGLSWERQTGYAPAVDAQIISNRLFATVPGAWRSLTAVPGLNYTAEIDLQYVDASLARVGVIGRASPIANTFYGARCDRQTTAFSLYKMIDGVETALGAAYVDAFTSGSRTLGLQMIGSAISLLVDGVSRVTVIDTDIAAPGWGGIRFSLGATATTGLHLTRYSVKPITTPVSDSFTDTNGVLLTAHAPEVGAGYVLQTGYSAANAPLILNGRARSQAASSVFRNVTPPGGANYIVKGVFDYIGASTDSCGLTARASATAQTLYFVNYRHGTGWALQRIVNGGLTQTLGTYADDFSSGSREVWLVVNGSAISVQIDGVTRIAATNAEIAADGFAGVFFGAAQSASTGRHLTSFRVDRILDAVVQDTPDGRATSAALTATDDVATFLANAPAMTDPIAPEDGLFLFDFSTKLVKKLAPQTFASYLESLIVEKKIFKSASGVVAAAGSLWMSADPNRNGANFIHLGSAGNVLAGIDKPPVVGASHTIPFGPGETLNLGRETGAIYLATDTGADIPIYGGYTNSNGFDARGEAVAYGYISRLSGAQTEAQRNILVQFMRDLNTADVLSALRMMYLLANTDAQSSRVDVVRPGVNLTLGSTAPTWERYVGYKGDGLAATAGTGYFPRDDAQVSPSKHGLGIYLMNNDVNSVGKYSVGNPSLSLTGNYTGVRANARSGFTPGNEATAVDSNGGLFAISRQESSKYNIVHNQNKFEVVRPGTTWGSVSYEVLLFAANGPSGPGGFSADTVGLVYADNGMPPEKHMAVATAFAKLRAAFVALG